MEQLDVTGVAIVTGVTFVTGDVGVAIVTGVTLCYWCYHVGQLLH